MYIWIDICVCDILCFILRFIFFYDGKRCVAAIDLDRTQLFLFIPLIQFILEPKFLLFAEQEKQQIIHSKQNECISDVFSLKHFKNGGKNIC